MKKLKRLMSWLKKTINEKIIIGAKSLTDVYTWMYAACAVHSYMRGQTGGHISMVHGVLHEKASVQRLNTKSSMEAELFGVSSYMPYNLCLMIFFHGKGCGIMSNMLYQCNQSAIRMEENGRNCCT